MKRQKCYYTTFFYKTTWFFCIVCCRSLQKNIHGSPSRSVCQRCVPILFSNTILSDPKAECILDSLFSSGNGRYLSFLICDTK